MHIGSSKLDSTISYPDYNPSPPRRARTALRPEPELAYDTGKMQVSSRTPIINLMDIVEFNLKLSQFDPFKPPYSVEQSVLSIHPPDFITEFVHFDVEVYDTSPPFFFFPFLNTCPYGCIKATRKQVWNLVNKAPPETTLCQVNWPSSVKADVIPPFSPIKKVCGNECITIISFALFILFSFFFISSITFSFSVYLSNLRLIPPYVATHMHTKNHTNSSKREIEIFGNRPVSPPRDRPGRLSEYSLMTKCVIVCFPYPLSMVLQS